jgi:hypothetical protein
MTSCAVRNCADLCKLSGMTRPNLAPVLAYAKARDGKPHCGERSSWPRSERGNLTTTTGGHDASFLTGRGFLLPPARAFSIKRTGNYLRLQHVRRPGLIPGSKHLNSVNVDFADYRPRTSFTVALRLVPASNTTGPVGRPCDPSTIPPVDGRFLHPSTPNTLQNRRSLCRVGAVRVLIGHRNDCR